MSAEDEILSSERAKDLPSCRVSWMKAAFVSIVSVALFFAASQATGLGFLYRGNWFGRSDLPAFRFWTATASAMVLPVALLVSWLSKKWSTRLLLIICGVLGLLGGYAWTMVAYLFLGPWINAFSIPVLFCWTVGSVAAFFGTSVLLRREAWIPASIGAPVLVLGVFLFLRWMSTPPPDLIVYLKPGATNDDVNLVWNTVLSHPAPSGFGNSSLEGIRTLSRADGPQNHGIRVGFQPRASAKRRAEIRTILLKSSLMESVVDANATPLGQVRSTVIGTGK